MYDLPTYTLPRRMLLLVFALVMTMSAMAAKRALLVGISSYPDVAEKGASWQKIHGANDLTLIAPILKRQGFSIQQLANQQATASRIRQALHALSQQTKQGDLVYIHFSGHGQPYEDLSGDEADGWDEALVPYDAQRLYSARYKGQNHIIDDELEKIVTSIRKRAGQNGYVYVVLDACHMGGASRDESEADTALFVRGTDQGFSPHGKKYVPRIDRRGFMHIKASTRLSGVCYVESCRAYQSNTEIKERGQYYGPLSYYVSQALQRTTLSADRGWLFSVVTEMARDRRLIRQNPVIESDR